MEKKNNLGRPVVTCTCSLHASGGYPCRHIISVALKKKEKITQDFFNDRMMKSQAKFLDGSSKPMENYCCSETPTQLDLQEPHQEAEREIPDHDTEDNECRRTTSDCDGLSTFSKERDLFMSQAQKIIIKSQHEIIWNATSETTENSGKEGQTRNRPGGVKRTRLTPTSGSNGNEVASTSSSTMVSTSTENPGISPPGTPVSTTFEDFISPLSDILDSSTAEPSEKKIKFSNNQLTYSFCENYSPNDKVNTLSLA